MQRKPFFYVVHEMLPMFIVAMVGIFGIFSHFNAEGNIW